MCRFDVNLHKKDLDLLNSIKDFFGVGKVYLNTNDSCIYTVQSIKDLAIIINHFNNYPLITQKLATAAPAGGLGLLLAKQTLFFFFKKKTKFIFFRRYFFRNN